MREGSRKAYLVIATTFLLGLLVGVVVSPLIWPRRPQPPQGNFQLSGELNLSSEQRVQVEKILTETRQQLQDVRKQFGQIRASSRDRISTVLTPEQQKAFELWKQRQDARRDRDHRRGDDSEKPRNHPPGKD
jgi:Spy/CpxP family protein refolding chaperone